MASNSIRSSHYLRDATDNLIEYMQGISGEEWGAWQVEPGYPDLEVGHGERQLLVWVEYVRTVEIEINQGGFVARQPNGTLLKGLFATVEFEIGARSGDMAGWEIGLQEFGSMLLYKFLPPFGPPTALANLGLTEFQLADGLRTAPTQDRPHKERFWTLTVVIPVVEEVT